MTITLQDLFTDEITEVKNVTGFTCTDTSVRVYTELNGKKDMNTYKMYMIISANK